MHKYWEFLVYREEDKTLVVGAMDFTESVIWAHMIVELVRAYSDIKVKINR